MAGIPDAKLGIIGNGERAYEEFLKNKVINLGLNNNVTWFGYINGLDKYKLYLQSKFFVHPTIYDNNGMVAAEALCSGLPVMMYDLKELSFYKIGCLKIKVGNKNQYSEEIMKLMTKHDYYNSVRINQDQINSLRVFWSWRQRADLFKNFLENYEKDIA